MCQESKKLVGKKTKSVCACVCVLPSLLWAVATTQVSEDGHVSARGGRLSCSAGGGPRLLPGRGGVRPGGARSAPPERAGRHVRSRARRSGAEPAGGPEPQAEPRRGPPRPRPQPRRAARRARSPSRERSRDGGGARGLRASRPPGPLSLRPVPRARAAPSPPGTSRSPQAL
ncbi:Citron Rho-Interacting Kinase [Manis pentadactyla]|nr:Citron Rho-Interacting Kinase [Manis pentadactyla]